MKLKSLIYVVLLLGMVSQTAPVSAGYSAQSARYSILIVDPYGEYVQAFNSTYSYFNGAPVSMEDSLAAPDGGGSAYVSADFGVLRTSAGAYTTTFGSRAESSTYAGWIDTITVASSTLAYGTPVQLTGTLSLHAIFSSTWTDPYSADGYVGNYLNVYHNGARTEAFNITKSTTPFSESEINEILSFTLSSFIGEELLVENFLASGVRAGNFGGPSPAPATVLLDATHTALFTLNSNTPEASYITESGTSYASLGALPSTSVPESTTSALLALGLGCLGLSTRLRKKPDGELSCNEWNAARKANSPDWVAMSSWLYMQLTGRTKDLWNGPYESLDDHIDLLCKKEPTSSLSEEGKTLLIRK